MATVKEMMMQDASASVGTAYMMSAGDTFEGNLGSMNDEDWIRIELTAGLLYTISLSGAATDGSPDTVLKLFDSKGGHIKTNDDIDGAKGDLNSEFQFAPEVSGYYYISAGSYNGNPNQDNSGDYTITVTDVDRPDPTVGEPIIGTEVVAEDPNTEEIEFMPGHDKLRGTDKGEMISGLSGNDALFGFGGDDTLDGGAGNDLLVGGAGADTLMGGMGNDTISYNVSTAGVTINLTDGTARGGDADGDTIVDMGGDQVENVVGSPHDDAITGNRFANILSGLSGNDELDGLRGNDTLLGGSGDDDLDGGRGNDKLEGGSGADVLTGGDGDDIASYAGSMMGVTVRLHNSKFMGGDAKGDTFGAMVAATYTDKDEDEQEVMLPDIMNLTGSGNADVLAGDFRNNIIMGGGGDDKIYGGPDPSDLDPMNRGDATNMDTLMGEGGNDMIWGGSGSDTLDGGAGNDMLRGGAGNDVLRGGAGSDMIYADADDASIDGYGVDDDGNDQNVDTDDPMDVDTLSYAMVENEDETGVIRELGDLAGGATINNIENIIGSDYDDTLTGDTQDNVIEGGEGRDTLNGAGGADTLSYASSDERVTVELAEGGAEAVVRRGHARGDMATNFENVMGSVYDDEIEGNTGDNVLMGGDGDDEIAGGTGADTIEGGAGADELDGGVPESDDNEAGDTLSYASSDAGVTVNLATARVSGGHASGDTITTVETDHDGDETTDSDVPTDGDNDDDSDTDQIEVATFERVMGSMHDDTLTGDHRMNVLIGGAGDDTLRGGAEVNVADGNDVTTPGGDHLVGGPGADMLDGGSSLAEGADTPDDDTDDVQHIDWAVYRGAMEGVIVNLATGMGMGGEAYGDTLVNIELVWGSTHDDTFIASNGTDLIHGDAGSDTVSYEASEMGVTVSLDTDNTSATPVTGDGTEDSPYVFPAGLTGDNPAVGDLDLNGVQPVLETPDEDESEDNVNTNGARGDRLGSIENLTGSAEDDMLTGDANPNVLKGMGGKDTLAGGGGNDTLMGGDGDDMLSAASGENMLVGGAGDDTLTGGTGDDTLNGGGGDDDLSGGGGDDTFVFSPMDGAGDSDAILDYTDGDMIDLSAFELTEEQLIGALTVRGTPGIDAYLVVNLTEFGGGRITIDDINDLDDLEETGGTTDNVIDTLDDGVFIL